MFKVHLEKNKPVQTARRSTIDQLFTMRPILEKSIEHNQKVFINFIDFKQAFDSIWHDGMWRVMQNTGIPEQLYTRDISKIIKFHKGRSQNTFTKKTGARQVLSYPHTYLTWYLKQ